MSNQRNENIQRMGMGMGLELKQKQIPTLTHCPDICEKCYKENPEGFT